MRGKKKAGMGKSTGTAENCPSLKDMRSWGGGGKMRKKGMKGY